MEANIVIGIDTFFCEFSKNHYGSYIVFASVANIDFVPTNEHNFRGDEGKLR
jgi:hypothetical protein